GRPSPPATAWRPRTSRPGNRTPRPSAAGGSRGGEVSASGDVRTGISGHGVALTLGQRAIVASEKHQDRPDPGAFRLPLSLSAGDARRRSTGRPHAPAARAGCSAEPVAAGRRAPFAV